MTQKRTPGVVASEKRKGSRAAKYGNKHKTAAAAQVRKKGAKCAVCGKTTDLTKDHDTGKTMCRSCNSRRGINKRWRKAGKK